MIVWLKIKIARLFSSGDFPFHWHWTYWTYEQTNLPRHQQIHNSRIVDCITTENFLPAQRFVGSVPIVPIANTNRDWTDLLKTFFIKPLVHLEIQFSVKRHRRYKSGAVKRETSLNYDQWSKRVLNKKSNLIGSFSSRQRILISISLSTAKYVDQPCAVVIPVSAAFVPSTVIISWLSGANDTMGGLGSGLRRSLCCPKTHGKRHGIRKCRKLTKSHLKTLQNWTKWPSKNLLHWWRRGFRLEHNFSRERLQPLASSRKLCFSSDLIKQKAEGRSEEMMPSYLRLHWMDPSLKLDYTHFNTFWNIGHDNQNWV